MSNEPLVQDWAPESNVRRVPSLPPITDPDPKEWLPRHAEARAQILSEASQHIAVALAALEEAIHWFSIVDPKDQGEVLRRVEALRDTIEYRASL